MAITFKKMCKTCDIYALGVLILCVLFLVLSDKSGKITSGAANLLHSMAWTQPWCVPVDCWSSACRPRPERPSRRCRLRTSSVTTDFQCGSNSCAAVQARFVGTNPCW